MYVHTLLNNRFAKKCKRRPYDIFSLIFVQVKELRDLCKYSGLSSSGSKCDMVLRLQRHIGADVQAFNKVYSKIWGASGTYCLTFFFLFCVLPSQNFIPPKTLVILYNMCYFYQADGYPVPVHMGLFMASNSS